MVDIRTIPTVNFIIIISNIDFTAKPSSSWIADANLIHRLDLVFAILLTSPLLQTNGAVVIGSVAVYFSLLATVAMRYA
jgi:hypothetical protein